MIELGGKLQAAEQTLMQVRAELAEEKRTSARSINQLDQLLRSNWGALSRGGSVEGSVGVPSY